MPHIYRSVVVPYSVEQMYALVNDVGAYPTFVPGCTESIVHEQSENEMRVTLTFSVKGILQSFTTVNKLQPHQLIEMRLAQGFFKQLNGFFRFENDEAGKSHIIFDLSFELSNPIFSIMYGALFQRVSERLMNAFIHRAKIVYGAKL